MDFVLDSVDNLDIINEIESRPCIWDSASPDYSDRGKKYKAWSDVALIFHPTLDLSDTISRNEMVRHLQRRWKSLRDSYSRELSRGKRKKPNDKRKVYMYFKRLAFLSDVVKAGLRSGWKNELMDEEDDSEHLEDSNLNYIIPDQQISYPVAGKPAIKSGVKIEPIDEDDDVVEDVGHQADSNLNYIIPDQQISCPVDAKPAAKHRKVSDCATSSSSVIINPRIDAQSPTIHQSTIGRTDPHPVVNTRPSRVAVPGTSSGKSEKSLTNGTVPDTEDFDRMFLLSLLHDLKKIPECRRLSVKGEIMKVIQDAQELSGMFS